MGDVHRFVSLSGVGGIGESLQTAAARRHSPASSIELTPAHKRKAEGGSGEGFAVRRRFSFRARLFSLNSLRPPHGQRAKIRAGLTASTQHAAPRPAVAQSVAHPRLPRGARAALHVASSRGPLARVTHDTTYRARPCPERGVSCLLAPRATHPSTRTDQSHAQHADPPPPSHRSPSFSASRRGARPAHTALIQPPRACTSFLPQPHGTRSPVDL